MKWWGVLLLATGCDQLFGFQHVSLPPDGPPGEQLPIDAPPGSWKKVSVGTDHTCALSVGGRVACWPTGSMTVPVYVDNSTAWTAISAGTHHVCGIRASAAVCWGANSAGESNASPAHTPDPVVTPTPVTFGVPTAIGAGTFHSCAIAQAGVVCWGNSQQTRGGSSGPVSGVFPASAGATALSTGYDHSCAIVNGAVWCWGGNAELQSNGSFSSTSTDAAQVNQPAPGTPIAVAAGYEASCAIAADAGSSTNTAYCWGVQSAFDATGASRSTTGTEVIGTAVPPWTDIVLGNHVTCALGGGTASCWGDAHDGGLPGAAMVKNIAPSDGTFATIAADQLSLEISDLGGSFSGSGGEHGCAVSNGNIMCWGPPSTPYPIAPPP